VYGRALRLDNVRYLVIINNYESIAKFRFLVAATFRLRGLFGFYKTFAG
jgi:hypothetical protein